MKITYEDINSNKMMITVETNEDVVTQIWEKEEFGASSDGEDITLQLEATGNYSERFLDKIYEMVDENFIANDFFKLMEEL